VDPSSDVLITKLCTSINITMHTVHICFIKMLHTVHPTLQFGCLFSYNILRTFVSVTTYKCPSLKYMHIIPCLM
jgi:hypothetical protein